MDQRVAGAISLSDSSGAYFDVIGKPGRSVRKATAQQHGGKHRRESDQDVHSLAQLLLLLVARAGWHPTTQFAIAVSR